MGPYLGVHFIITVNVNKTLKLKRTKIFSSRSGISWTFTQHMFAVKIFMLHVQRVDYLIKQDSFLKNLFE